jgi:TolA-binding protein
MLDASERATAASIVFEVAHPIADAGDDSSSGPMMQLVIAYWPTNYMALYHAGMSEYSLGELRLAEQHLKSFLEQYNADDSFTQSAKRALAGIGKVQWDGKRPLEHWETARP